MKSKIALFALTLVPFFGFSQTTFEYGGRIGASFSSFSYDYSSLSGNIGLVAGGMANYNINSAMQLVGNLDYHQLRGNLQSYTLAGSNVLVRTNTLTLNTAELSALFAYRLPLPFLGTASPKIMGGGSVAYNFYTLNNKVTTIGGYQISASSSDEVTSSFENFLYAAQAGLQFEFLLDEGSFSAVIFDIRYRRNINALTSGLSVYGTGSPSDIYSNSLIMTFGLIIN
ncbi:MAG: hypothetical protein HC811_00675 [Flammeovirgaceae bacterium]|nr:hypothetical protein [Flammeovirgaceae bacterium]